VYFMRDDEFLLLMQYNPSTLDIYKSTTPSVGERIRLHDVGIRTALENPRWKAIEPSKGNYDFTVIEDILRWNREASLKTIFTVCDSLMPDWMPDSWFAKNKAGIPDRYALSLWNKEAQDYVHGYYVDLIMNFASKDEDVMFIMGEYMEGEAILPCAYSFYDEYALDDYRNKYGSSAVPDINTFETLDWLAETAVSHFIRMQTLFQTQCNEIWNMQQFLMNKWSKATINYAQPEIMEACNRAFPDVKQVLLQYTYFDVAHEDDNVQYVDRLIADTGCEAIVEAMFCAGLAQTTPKAIAKGFRGQVVAPTHPHTQRPNLEDWMVVEIKKSLDLWRASKEA
jgi:hypothetical protein